MKTTTDKSFSCTVCGAEYLWGGVADKAPANGETQEQKQEHYVEDDCKGGHWPEVNAGWQQVEAKLALYEEIRTALQVLWVQADLAMPNNPATGAAYIVVARADAIESGQG